MVKSFLWMSLLALPVAFGGTIGPDSFGYQATNGLLSWTDISATGTARFVPPVDDQSAGPIDLGFGFNFYGTIQTQAFVSTNGLLTFGAGDSDFSNDDLSGGDQPNPVIAPYWDDLIAGAGAAQNVYTQTQGAPGSQRFIAQWTMGFFGGNPAGAINFQVILFETSNLIQFQYLNLQNTDGTSATVGIADANGLVAGRFLQWSFNGDLDGAPAAESSITFSPTVDGRVPEPGSLGLMGAGLAFLGLMARRHRRN